MGFGDWGRLVGEIGAAAIVYGIGMEVGAWRRSGQRDWGEWLIFAFIALVMVVGGACPIRSHAIAASRAIQTETLPGLALASLAPHNPAMPPGLTEDGKAILVEILQIDRAPAPRPPDRPSMVLAKKRRRR